MKYIKVLIVDDNKEFTGLVNEYFKFYKKSGIEMVGIANNGIEGLQKISELEPDVVILDIIMPNLDGISLLEKVKTMKLKKKPQFIVLSAVGTNRVKQAALGLEAISYIEKPFDMELLVSKILQLKGKSGDITTLVNL